MTEEMWKDIKGFEGQYQISSEGRVKSLARKIINKSGREQNIKERILKVRTRSDGYNSINLSNGSGKLKTFLVHRLVCEAFHPNPDNKPEVNHIDENKSNNRACNLEWSTRKENNNHGTHNMRVAKTTSKPVAQYTLDGQLVNIWDSAIELTKQIGFDPSSIYKVANGKRKSAYGYLWKYISKEDNVNNQDPNSEFYISKENNNHRVSNVTSKGFSKVVAQYTLSGELVRIYESARKAGKENGFGHATISAAARGDKKSAYGYLWKYITDKDKVNNSKLYNQSKGKGFSKSVAQYTLDGKLIKVYKSACEAERQSGFSSTNISATALGKQKTHKGYIWKYVSQ